jgi:hypothetical protein
LVAASEVTVILASEIMAIGFTSRTIPGNSIPAVQTFLSSFDDSRVLSIDVYYDQRGTGSLASQLRATAWIASDIASSYAPEKLDQMARYAGPGMNTIVPGKRYRLPVGPKFRAGRFGDQVTPNTLVLATQDYIGTIRIVTTYELYGPPIDYKIVPPVEAPPEPPPDDPCDLFLRCLARKPSSGSKVPATSPRILK